MALSYGKGSLLKLGGTSVGKILTISHSSTCSEIDVTHTESDHMETAPGLVDPGSVDAEILYESSMTVAVGTSGNWSVEVGATPDKTYTFSGFVTKWDLSGLEVNGVAKVALTIRCTSLFD